MDPKKRKPAEADISELPPPDETDISDLPAPDDEPQAEEKPGGLRGLLSRFAELSDMPAGMGRVDAPAISDEEANYLRRNTTVDDGQAFLETAINVPLQNYYPQINAGMTALGLDLLGVDEKHRPSYEQMKNEIVQRMGSFSRRHPTGAGLATGLGAVADYKMLAPAMGKLLPKPLRVDQYATGLTKLKRAGAAATTNAGMGALYNPSHEYDPDDPLRIRERVKQAIMAGGLGFMGQKAIDDIVRPTGALSGDMLRHANEYRRKAYEAAAEATGAGTAQTRQWSRQGVGSGNQGDPVLQNRKQAIGKDLLDQGLVGWFTSPKALQEELAEAVPKLTQELNDILEGKGLGNLEQWVASLPPETQQRVAQRLNDVGYDPRFNAQQVFDELFEEAFNENPVLRSAANQVYDDLREHTFLTQEGLDAPAPRLRPDLEPRPAAPAAPASGPAPHNPVRPQRAVTDGPQTMPAPGAPAGGLSTPGSGMAPTGQMPPMGGPLDTNKIFNLMSLIEQKRRLRNIKGSYWGKGSPEIPFRVEANKRLGNRLQSSSEAIADVINDASGGKLGDLGGTNRLLGNLMEAQDAVDETLIRTGANQKPGLLDTAVGAGLGTAMAGLGDPSLMERKGNSANPGSWGGRMAKYILGGVIGASMNRARRTYQPSFSAKMYQSGAWMMEALGPAAQRARELIQNNPQTLGRFFGALDRAQKKSPEAFNAAVWSFLQDPGFRELVLEDYSFEDQPLMEEQEARDSFLRGMRGQ